MGFEQPSTLPGESPEDKATRLAKDLELEPIEASPQTRRLPLMTEEEASSKAFREQYEEDIRQGLFAEWQKEDLRRGPVVDRDPAGKSFISGGIRRQLNHSASGRPPETEAEPGPPDVLPAGPARYYRKPQ